MELKDLLLAPFYLAIIYAFAFRFRKNNTDKFTKRYYIPALTVKLVGAVALGLIYQFYYKGGDTYNYFHDSGIIWEALLDSPSIGIKMLLSQGRTFDYDTYLYTQQMHFYSDYASYTIVRVSAFIGFFTFHTYTINALLFACLSFSGVWALFRAFNNIYPQLHKELAIAIFFLPSVFFWGSGLMKDTICMGALGWLFYGFYFGTIKKNKIFKSIIIITVSMFVLITVKVYILLAFFPPGLFWIFNENNARIKNKLLKIIAKPAFFTVGIIAAYFGATRLTQGDVRYDISKIGERTKINSEYLYAVSMQENGSAYSIGSFDGSLGSIFAVAPQAVNVALFRPYLWEVRNPVMLLSSLEATAFLLLTIYLFLRTGIGNSIRLIALEPLLTFCFIFCIIMAFAVGVNSFNFGTLVRYKIPLMPFYLGALYIMRFYTDKKRYKLYIATKKQKAKEKYRPGVATITLS
ncbi:MAG: hypothetical protein V4714_22550 [Bacteroidota bacterium]